MSIWTPIMRSFASTKKRRTHSELFCCWCCFCLLGCFGTPACKKIKQNKSFVSSYFATGLEATALFKFRLFYNEWIGIQIKNDNATENLITRAKLMNQHKEQLFVLFCCWLFSCWFFLFIFFFLFSSWLIASSNV